MLQSLPEGHCRSVHDVLSSPKVDSVRAPGDYGRSDSVTITAVWTLQHIEPQNPPDEE
jgi:hypothetical protein